MKTIYPLDVPPDLPKFKLDTIDRLRKQLLEVAHVGPLGEYRWDSNDQIIGVDTLREAFVMVPPRQAEAREVQVTEQLAEYRERMRDHVPSAEEMYEMRSAFGPGRTVVNAITGQRFRT